MDARTASHSNEVTGIVLAAGTSGRMGGANKLLISFRGIPIVRRVVEAVLESKCRRVVVVLGHEAERVQQALSDLRVDFVHNPEFREGIAASVRAGASAVDNQSKAVVFCLGDMPLVSAEVIDRLIAAFDPSSGLAAWQAAFEGQRGNPVLWSTSFLDDLRALRGDEGARALMRRHAELVATVQMNSAGVLTDIDTPDDLSKALNDDGR